MQGIKIIWKIFLAPLHPSSNIEISSYFSYELRFSGVFSRDDLPRIKNIAYVINIDEKQSKGTH